VIVEEAIMSKFDVDQANRELEETGKPPA